MAEKPSPSELQSVWVEWDMSKFSGRRDEDPQAWLTRVENGCDMRDIPVSQRMLTAVHFLGGTLKVVMKSVKKHLKSRQEIPSCTEKWDEFKKSLLDLHGDSDYSPCSFK
jgi:hypothetical protein